MALLGLLMWLATAVCLVQDVWDVCWASDNSDLLAVMEKGRMVVLRGTEAEEPVNSSAWLAGFCDLKVCVWCRGDARKAWGCWAHQLPPQHPTTFCAAADSMEQKACARVSYRMHGPVIADTAQYVCVCVCVLCRCMQCCWMTSCSSHIRLNSA